MNAQTKMPYAVMIVDDHSQLPHGWGPRLRDFFPDVITAADSAEAYQKRLAKRGAVICLVDLRMPDERGDESVEVGFKLVEQLHGPTRHRSCRVVSLG